MNSQNVVTIIFGAVVSLLFWIIKGSLSTNFKNINDAISELKECIEKKVDKENCTLQHKRVDEIIEDNNEQHVEIYTRLNKIEIIEAKHGLRDNGGIT